ncbi:M16 family metallopeptidase [Lutibaculum baratangense]|uniref:Zinc protease n=1 Tax=Lutibaculum baratangense AMV1 TaxID=631454 RepID=V4RQG9_9HYPH|nr:pitrilysin family protein [Lutibaculum baratangense]ESR27499.1 Zinc protease [Lutibaculum baratangense AMV1]
MRSFLAMTIPHGAIGAAAALGLLVFTATPSGAVEVERVTSPGGIEAWLVEESAVPIVTMNFAFRGGASQDPAERPGVANMLSTLLDEGAGDLDSQAFQERLADLNVRMSFNATRDAFYGQLVTIADYRADAFDLLRLALNEPRFDEEPIERMRSRIEAGIRSDLQDPNAIAGRAWSAAVFGEHPYGSPVEGTLESVAAITPDDVARLHGSMFARDNLTVAVVGDIGAEELGPLLDTVFGGLPESADLTEVSEADMPRDAVVEQVEMAIPQSVIQFGRPGLKRDDEDFIPAFVMNHILGGGTFSSRLYEEIREKRGLAYSVYTHLAPLDRAGLFVGGVATRADRAGESLRIIKSEIERMAVEGSTEKELEDAKKYLKGSYPLRFDSSGKIARQLVEIQLEDLGIDYIDRRNDLIDAVTIEDVRRAAGEVLGDGALYVVLVGQPVGDALEAPAEGG